MLGKVFSHASMKLHRKILSALLVCSSAASLVAGPNENATLTATVDAGELTIRPASVNGPWSPTSGAVTVTGAVQNDAVTFAIDGITIDDLNGDGQGFQLTATPGTLTNGASTMAIGTNAGFNNPSVAGSTTIVDANTVDYTGTSGVFGYTIDYDIAYNVPAFAAAGTYTGTIAFAVVAQ